MKPLSKCIAGLLVVTVIGLISPKTSLGADMRQFAKIDQKAITVHEPRSMASPEQELSSLAAKDLKKKKTNWLLVGVTTVLVAGLVVAVGSMGAGGGSSDGGSPTPDNGDVSVQW